jgi:hypothetical protein
MLADSACCADRTVQVQPVSDAHSGTHCYAVDIYCVALQRAESE